MDRFKDQLEELKEAEKDLMKTLKERALVVKKGESTGKVGTYFPHLIISID